MIVRGQRDLEWGHAARGIVRDQSAHVFVRRRLVHAAPEVDTCIDAGHVATRRDEQRLLARRIAHPKPGRVDRGIRGVAWSPQVVAAIDVTWCADDREPILEALALLDHSAGNRSGAVGDFIGCEQDRDVVDGFECRQAGSGIGRACDVHAPAAILEEPLDRGRQEGAIDEAAEPVLILPPRRDQARLRRTAFG